MVGAVNNGHFQMGPKLFEAAVTRTIANSFRIWILGTMTDVKRKQELQAKLDRYETLARQFSDGATYENIRKEIESLQRQLRALER